VRPVLFSIFNTPIYTYAAATVVGYVVGVLVGVALARRDGRSWRDLVDTAIVAVISAVLGAKVFHTLFEAEGHELRDGTHAHGLWDLLRDDPFHWARLFDAGYVFYGGLLGATLFVYIFVKRQRFDDIGAYGDYAAPALSLGYFVGRLGCFFGGCCHGTPTQLPWAVTYPQAPLAGLGPIHPVQLYEAAFGLIAFVGILLLYKRRRFSGELFALFMVTYALSRFFFEFFRGDGDRGVWVLSLSTSQWIALLVLPATVFFWWRAKKAAESS
jgi:phosphatidylglycerol:prolipoprotein diacylglycerol transferase